MDTKKIVSSILYLVGIALIIICFQHFGRNLEARVNILNTVVSCFIFSLLFMNVFSPIIDLKDKSQKGIGGLGVKWFFSIGYILVAIGSMRWFNSSNAMEFNSQLIAHCIFLFLLFLGLYLSVTSSAKAEEVYVEEGLARSRVDDMKKATKDVGLRLEQLKNIQPNIFTRVSALQEQLRYLSPCNNQSALILEENYLKEMQAVRDLLYGPFDEEKIMERIKNCEVTYRERKHNYSN
jgi:hypothetical protein